MESPGGAAPLDSATRYRLAVQKNRAIVFTLAVLLCLGLRYVGVLEVSAPQVFGLGALALVSAALIYQLVRAGKGSAGLDTTWILLDVGLISFAVWATDGANSPWYPWYLASISAAAFALGQRAAFGTWLASTGGYVGALAAKGDIVGPGPELTHAVAVMVCLYAASFFFLRGVRRLTRKQGVIAEMQEESRKKVAELVRLTSNLEEKTRETSEANLRLREADRLKSQFLANVSHELRTPLNSIIGFSEILQSKLASQLDDRQSRFLGYINESGERLLSIINDILDLSRMEAGSMELARERMAVRSTVEGICTLLKGPAARKEVFFDLDVPADLPLLEADPTRIKQVLYHLIDNAVKFSREQSRVEIRARWLAAGQSPLGVDSLTLEVVDHGVGMDPQERDAIFEPFRQVDGTASREYQGAGLGLALVGRAVELHGGRVEVETAVGKGSTFRVLLPAELQTEATVLGTDALVPLSPGDEERQVLVVEDDPTAYRVLAEHLSEAGYLPVRARTGDEALERAKTLRPAAITLDMVLPGTDGMGVLRILRADPETRHIPIVMISLLDNRELGLALGADDYFVKPVDSQALLARLEALIPAAGGARKLLFIDDDPRLHEMMASLLGGNHFSLLHAHSGRVGVEIAERERPDLIVLDLMMEEMDGFETASLLKANEATRDLPIVVFTAKDTTAGEREALNGKIEALVQKGEWQPSRLESVIRDVIRRYPVRSQPGTEASS